MPDHDYLQATLDKYSTKFFNIEYKEYLSNHVAHAIIALHTLGATEEQVHEYCDWYVQKIERPGQETVNPLEKDDGKGMGSWGEGTAYIFKHEAKRLIDLVNQLELPAKACGPHPDAAELANFVVDTALRIYTAFEHRNGFLILHGATGAWSVKTVLSYITDPDVVIEAARTMLFTLLFLYLRAKCPAVHEEYLAIGEGETMDDLAQQALKLEGHPDEHIYKLVQVCKLMEKERGDLTGLYRAAAKTAVAFPIYMG